MTFYSPQYGKTTYTYEITDAKQYFENINPFTAENSANYEKKTKFKIGCYGQLP